MMLARAAAISSGQGRGRGDVEVVAAAAFPAREVDAAADLHRWHLGAMRMLFRSVSSSLPSTSSANVGEGATSDKGVGGIATANPLLHQHGRRAFRDHDHAGQQA
jgi:hypothetical protein